MHAHSPYTLYKQQAVLRYTVQDAHIYIVWLMGAPGGLKLNGSLAAFLATVFSQYLSWWSALLASAAPFLPMVVAAIAASGLLGLSGVCVCVC